MVLEPIIGFLICGALLLLSRVYLAYFQAEAARHPEFEAWVATKPLVMAMRCPEADAVELLYVVREKLGRGVFLNPAGGYPWQHYVVTFEARRLENGVVGLFAVAARRKRTNETKPVFGPWLDALSRTIASRVDEAWLHGKLRSPGVGTVADRERMGWSARMLADEGLVLEPMIGQPEWVPELGKAA